MAMNPAFLRMVRAQDSTKELLGKVESLYGIVIPRELDLRGNKVILRIPNATILSSEFPETLEFIGSHVKVREKVWRTIVKPLIEFTK